MFSFIAIDDLNDWTGLLGGHPQAKTPNLDRLMKRGVSFTNAHCAAPACNPSRAALMSGLRPFETGVYTNSIPAAPVLKDTLTINRHFLAQGYRTVGGGKIYHGFGSEGREDTWTEWVGIFPTTGNQIHNVNGLNRDHFDWGPLDATTEDMGDTKLTDWAIGELQKPPNSRCSSPSGISNRISRGTCPANTSNDSRSARSGFRNIPRTTSTTFLLSGIAMAKPDGDHAAVIQAGQWELAVQGYLATISYLDEQIGRLLDATRLQPAGRQDRHRCLERPRLASRRKAALAEICPVGGSDPVRLLRCRAWDRPRICCLPGPGGFPERLSDRVRTGGPAGSGTRQGTEPDATAERSRGRLESRGPMHPWARQSRRPRCPLSLHPLRQRRGGIVLITRWIPWNTPTSPAIPSIRKHRSPRQGNSGRRGSVRRTREEIESETQERQRREEKRGGWLM